MVLKGGIIREMTLSSEIIIYDIRYHKTHGRICSLIEAVASFLLYNIPLHPTKFFKLYKGLYNNC